MRQPLLWFSVFVLLLFLLPGLTQAAPPPADRLAGTIEARLDGQLLHFPLLKSEYAIDLQGDLATVTLSQTFANPAQAPLNARYLFPLSHDAAVFEMTMQIGQERIRAQIQETGQAQKTFEKARSEGRAAALLREHRPNMFTQQIANLMPGIPVQLTLRYVQTVPKVDNAYELVVPLVVGPRFQPPQAGLPPPDAGPEAPEAGRWELAQLPAYPPVHGLGLPPAIEPERLRLALTLDGGMPILRADSRTHALAVQADSATRWQLGLAEGRAIDNRDFVLRYQLAGQTTQAGLLVQNDARGGYFSLLLEPPAVPSEAQILPREMVFLLDCSGSMHGLPMDASKAFMRAALATLRAADHFRIIRFSDRATEFSDRPLAATPENLRRGLAYIESLQGEGGTMMSSGIERALQAAPLAGTQRLVTFLTDGYIGNEYEILRLVQQHIGAARLYAFGVGSGVNRFLLDEIGRAGRGFTRYMDPTEAIDRVVAELVGKLQSPVLADIAIDWGELAPREVYPQDIPDLFAGQSLRIQGRFDRPGSHVITVRGNTPGQQARLLLPVNLPAKTESGDAVGLVWARAAIREAGYRMALPPALLRERGADVPDFEQLKARVIELGLKFALVTKWTSFVAVSERVYNTQPAAAVDADVPLPKVAGVGASAYATPAAPFAGAAGPEAAGSWSLALLMALLLASRWRRQAPAR